MVHCGRGDARARGLAQRLVRVERRRLVRVLAVPQRPLQRHRYGQHRRRGAITHLGPHPLSHLQGNTRRKCGTEACARRG
eukprot:351602-Chlamydomonas_euryale.AAC.2